MCRVFVRHLHLSSVSMLPSPVYPHFHLPLCALHIQTLPLIVPFTFTLNPTSHCVPFTFTLNPTSHCVPFTFTLNPPSHAATSHTTHQPLLNTLSQQCFSFLLTLYCWSFMFCVWVLCYVHVQMCLCVWVPCTAYLTCMCVPII